LIVGGGGNKEPESASRKRETRGREEPGGEAGQKRGDPKKKIEFEEKTKVEERQGSAEGPFPSCKKDAQTGIKNASSIKETPRGLKEGRGGSRR